MNISDNLLSGFIGAIIGSLVQPCISWLNLFNKNNKIRIAIGSYLHQVIQLQLDTYNKDCIGAINEIIKNPINDNKDRYVYDALPMLNSELMKAYKAEELLSVFQEKNTYIKFMELAYSLDYLKSKMPIEFVNEYYLFLDEHFNLKGITLDMEKQKHIDECSSIKMRQTILKKQIELRNLTSNKCKDLTMDLLAEIKFKII